MEQLCEALKVSYRKHALDWPKDDVERNTYEALRQVLRVVSIGHSVYVEADHANPQLSKLESVSRQFQLPSPDCVYHSAPLNGAYTYRIRGNRGSAALFQITTYRGHACNLRNWKPISTTDSLSDPALGPNADVDITLSRTRHDGPWLELPSGDCEVQVRQYYADWNKEEPARLMIERVGGTLPAEPTTSAEYEERFQRIVDMLLIHADYYRDGVNSHFKASADELPILDIPGALEGATYVNGYYRCKPDEAVIIELDEPDAPYWNFALYNLQWEAMEWHLRQTSTNRHQAHIDSDGRLRLVISHQDPGVLNWLDASGRTLGLICGRYFRAKSKPLPRLKTVPFSALRSYLPDDTPSVTPAERHALLHRRLASVFRRLCSDY
jgi:hypothetical protein